MQQYFIDQKIDINKPCILRDDIIYHLTKVLRLTNKTFRLVDNEGSVFLASLDGNIAKILERIEENNELECDITAVVALIKQDKFELTLQKLTELGVKKIVPYNAYRSVVKEVKKDKKLERYTKILTEASEQSHRNFVPEITQAIDIKDLEKYKSDINLIAYEKEADNFVGDLKANSITFIVGPEGGFEEKELQAIMSLGFKSISLGKRILRAETAAIYLASLIAGSNQ